MKKNEKLCFFGNNYRYMCIYRYASLIKKEVIMEKERCQIKCTETDDGYRIEISGKDIKEKLSGCCIPISKKDGGIKIECCPPEDKKE